MGYCLANVVSGTVLDKKGNPVANMEIMYDNAPTIILTDENGEFAFEAETTGNDFLTFGLSKTEYLVVPLWDKSQLTVTLKSEKAKVDFGDSSIELPYKEIPTTNGEANVITREQIAKANYKDLNDALRGQIPGVVITDNGGVEIRSGLPCNPLFIVDGVECWGGPSPNDRVAIESVEKIEVIRDGSMYGLKGAGGIIKIYTRR